MLLLLDKLISTIAPHQCLGCGVEGALLCPDCVELLPALQPRCYKCGRTDNGWRTCQSCRRTSPFENFENVFICAEYEGVAEQLIRNMKFDYAINAADVIAKVASGFQAAFTENPILVPVPTATSRVRERGYDQSVVIATRLAKYAGLPHSQVLIRYSQQRQTNSSRKERLTQLEGAFSLRRNKIKITDKVLLVDDVLTTGATLEAAARTLRQSGIKHIDALVFARA